MPSCGAETHLFFSHLAIDASDTSASRTWGPCRPASPIAPSEASYEGRNELEECLDNFSGPSLGCHYWLCTVFNYRCFGLGSLLPDITVGFSAPGSRGCAGTTKDHFSGPRVTAAATGEPSALQSTEETRIPPAHFFFRVFFGVAHPAGCHATATGQGIAMGKR